VNFLILVIVVAAVAYRVTAPDDRVRYVTLAAASLRELKAAATAPRPDYDEFVEALRARAPRLVAVPVLVAVNVAFAALMIAGPGSLSDPSVAVRWGANIGTRTTNGEWWRLVVAVFQHTSVVLLVLDTVVILHIGAVAERLIGRATLAVVFVSAGVMGGLEHVAAHPVDASTSATPAIAGIYGLVAACVVWQTVRGRREIEPEEDAALFARITVPRIALKRLAIVGAVFFLFNAIAGYASGSQLTGFGVGLAYGIVLGWRVAERAPAARAVGIASVVCALAVVACAAPLRHIADVRPAVDAIVETEARTAAEYQKAFEEFSRQRISADALADVADGTIVPALVAADARMMALQHVPAEHQAIVDAVHEFVGLRCAGWRARADALRRTHRNLRAADVGGNAAARVQAEGRFRSTMAAAGKAEAAERAASDAFARVKQTYSWRPIAE